MNLSRIATRLLTVIALLVAPVVCAQARVEDARLRQEAILQGQQKTSAAYRELQQAEYAAKQAEQDYQKADVSYKAAQKRADESRQKADAAKKHLDAAKAKELQARKSYEAAVNAVNQTWQKPQK